MPLEVGAGALRTQVAIGEFGILFLYDPMNEKLNKC